MKIRACEYSNEPETVDKKLNNAINNVEWRDKTYKFLI